ncbi:conserved hypothetical protein [Neospora caninum Liverpool]|uniref:Protein FAM33A n=1 Tax=Neospora caninum (strain Liverpool) TaxID=572307 RepID=F0VGU2_NEOCL|nr:conserved hypothetical protein [Neospora caninum Liverpool]CBZ52936.1 conserved hypothetical protein [Neospora caninum Liverpool]CEL66920.1 TPA: hypothetical protein BN1204_027250 [Neospora caninum Liverpool]|eukprot:XP_003882968.1 conserved hypothetical protein [Neospora caninum Liverpool]
MEDAIQQLRDRFECMSTDLFIVEQRLDQEFALIYGPERHPRHLLQRLAKVQKDIQTLSDQFQARAILKGTELLFTAKSQLADTLRQQLRAYELLGALQEAAGGAAPEQDIRCEQIYQEGEELLRRWMKTDQRAMQFPELVSDEKGLDRSDVGATPQGSAAPPDTSADGVPARNIDQVSGISSVAAQETAGPGASSAAETSAAAPSAGGARSRVFPDFGPPRDSAIPDGERGSAEQHKQQNRGPSEEPEDEACVCGYSPIPASVFERVPALTRRRARLGDVNALFHCLHHMRYEKGKEGTSTTIKELNQMNFRVVGQTGEAKLSTLRYLRLVDVNARTGSVRLLVPQKTRAPPDGRGNRLGPSARTANQSSSSLRTRSQAGLSTGAARAAARGGGRREFGREKGETRHKTVSRRVLGKGPDSMHLGSAERARKKDEGPL